MAKSRSPKPRRKPDEIIPWATEALQLAGEDRESLEPRLGAGLLDGAGADLAQVVPVVSGTKQKRAEKRAATATQNELAQRAAEMVMNIRTALNVSSLSAAAKKRYGVGLRVQPTVVSSVVTGGNALLSQADLTPDEIRGTGVLPADLDGLRALLAELSGADTAQENKKVSAKNATAQRNATLRRLEDAVRKIAAAGLLANAANPERRARYAALLEGPSKSKRNGGGGTT